jgi:hypothetical protein
VTDAEIIREVERPCPARHLAERFANDATQNRR